MQPMVNIALRAARIAGEQIARSIERLDLIKSEDKDVAKFLSETCKQAESTVVTTIQKAYPNHKIICEHSGTHEPLKEGPSFCWHVNPIDSLSNFSNGLPAFAFSITGYQNDRIEHAIILNPLIGEEFTASRGRGAQLNGRRLRVSNRKTLDGSLIGSGFFNRTSDKPHFNVHQEMVKNVTLAGGTLYNGGSAVLNLAYTAAGRLDGFFQLGLHESEVEAGTLLLQEAGGLVADCFGTNKYRENGHVVAGNPKMFKAILQGLRPALTPDMQ
ncbi:inositol monophosphatase [Pontibacterium sp. N1Y112]|uniref:Inositol monophosphatase n=1 Tax=Pontibacterium sinense TaxID=2781979 RepID=A0A8J7FFI2_9GAMM|nr:inositol monophosphatase [Pontibacterium sinense]MBE9398661.1 inositol monophosphatase [Pontibacterium sinense]